MKDKEHKNPFASKKEKAEEKENMMMHDFVISTTETPESITEEPEIPEIKEESQQEARNSRNSSFWKFEQPESCSKFLKKSENNCPDFTECIENTIPNLRVLSYQEIPDEKQIKIVSSVGQ